MSLRRKPTSENINMDEQQTRSDFQNLWRTSLRESWLNLNGWQCLAAAEHIAWLAFKSGRDPAPIAKPVENN